MRARSIVHGVAVVHLFARAQAAHDVERGLEARRRDRASSVPNAPNCSAPPPSAHCMMNGPARSTRACRSARRPAPDATAAAGTARPRVGRPTRRAVGRASGRSGSRGPGTLWWSPTNRLSSPASRAARARSIIQRAPVAHVHRARTRCAARCQFSCGAASRDDQRMATQDLDALARRRAELRETYLVPDSERPASNGGGVHHLALICADPETHDPLLPGRARVPARRAVREPRLRGLVALLLRHRRRQHARVLRLPRPRPRTGARRASAVCSTSRSRSTPESSRR